MRTRNRRDRYQPTLAYRLADQARSAGVDLDAALGPWRVGQRRRDLELITVVTNGRTEFMVDGLDHAADVAGLLNWCRLDHFEPVPELLPPADAERIDGELLEVVG